MTFNSKLKRHQIMQPSIDPKREQLRQAVAEQTSHYLALGRRITELPPQEFTYRLCTVRGGGNDGDPLLLMQADKRRKDGTRERVLVKGARGAKRACVLEGGA